MGIMKRWKITEKDKQHKGKRRLGKAGFEGSRKGKKRRNSLKKTLFLYIVSGIIVTVTACLLIVEYFESWQYIIRSTYGITEKEVLKALHTVYAVEMSSVSDEGLKQLMILDHIQMLSIFVCIILGIVIVSRLYYKKNLEFPLEVLKKEIEHIEQNELDYDCSYYSGDEMEEICNAFNHMRLRLIENQKNMWRLLEKQKELNAAFAHDIRTPVTVMKGYSQMLLKYYEEGRISEEKLFEALQMIDRQGDRLEHFSDVMKEMHALDEWRVEKKEITLGEIMNKLTANLKGMEKEGIRTYVSCEESGSRILNCDMHLIEEVADNLFTNAIRHAKEKVELKGSLWEEKLYLYVKDDGSGFSGKAKERALRPYFTTDKEHVGMGLTICKTLCEKHGGKLELTNSIEGGAIVCAAFETDVS